MPFVVTTKRPTDRGFSLSEEPVHEISRRAVATLEEARTRCSGLCKVQLPMPEQAWRDLAAQWQSLTESGGTVGPLPDGTVVKVEMVSWTALAYQAGMRDRVLAACRSLGEPEDKKLAPFPPHTEIIAAYNAKQATA